MEENKCVKSSDTIEALRAENAKLRALLDDIRKNLNDISAPLAEKHLGK